MTMQRREFLKVAAAAGLGTTAALALPGCATTAGGSSGRVVIIGGGYGGATAAKYIRMWSNGGIDVTVVEPNPEFISCPMSNLVLGGSRDPGVPHGQLRQPGQAPRREGRPRLGDRHRCRKARGQARERRRTLLRPAGPFAGRRLHVGQGPGLNNVDAQAKVLHAWKAGPQTVALRIAFEAMPDGGVYVLSIPVAPYRCPPGPYERACQVAWYFKRAKPRSKVLILDGNGDVTSKGPLFKKAWAEEYKGIVEYRGNHVLADVDVAAKTAKFDVQEDVRTDVPNIVPPQRAGAIARSAGVVTANDRWCDVDFQTFESVKVKNVHVLGDAIQVATGMPKSGHMANQHGKVCAAAVVALLSGQPPNATPVLTNTCYSMVTDKDSIHVCSVHQWDRDKKTLLPVPGAGGVSAAMSELEGNYAFAWAKNIWADTLA